MDFIALYQLTFDGLPTLSLHAPAEPGKLRQLIIEALKPPSAPLEELVGKGGAAPSKLYPVLLVEFDYAFAERVPCEGLAQHLANVKDELDMSYHTFYTNELGLRHIARKLMHLYRAHRRKEGLSPSGSRVCFYEAFAEDRFSVLTLALQPSSRALAVA